MNSLTYPYLVALLSEKACIDEKALFFLDGKVLRHVETAPDHIISIIFLNSYLCYMMAFVVNGFKDLGITFVCISEHCTGLCQPVNI